jgi:hypothetical protein
MMDDKWGRAVGGWADQMTAEGRLKGKDNAKKEVRAGKYEAAEVISAGEVIDNLVCPFNSSVYCTRTEG